MAFTSDYDTKLDRTRTVTLRCGCCNKRQTVTEQPKQDGQPVPIRMELPAEWARNGICAACQAALTAADGPLMAAAKAVIEKDGGVAVHINMGSCQCGSHGGWVEATRYYCSGDMPWQNFEGHLPPGGDVRKFAAAIPSAYGFGLRAEAAILAANGFKTLVGMLGHPWRENEGRDFLRRLVQRASKVA